jgi:TM2 domain-containing membrane protein YozV
MAESQDDITPKRKSFVTALLLSIYLGYWGIDRFYLGYIWQGVVKLLTFGACGVWHSVDIILIATGKMKDAKGNELER